MSILSPATEVDLNLHLPSLAGEVRVSDRRADVDAKQQQVAAFLASVGCEGLLILDQANLAWLTSGAVARSVLDPDELPGLYYNASQRWLLAANVESQRMFDEELDGLGFLLKEWPWHWGRRQLLADLCQGRTVASDTAVAGARPVAEAIQVARRILTAYEQACARRAGAELAHALEATCRSARPGDTERELAGQLSHRLLRRGVLPAAISVAGDGRLRSYRRHAFTSAPVERHAVVSATARKYGLYVTASRSFSFGPPEERVREQHYAACKVAATFMASTWPDCVAGDILQAGMRIYRITGWEHEWQLCPQGHVTGRQPVEHPFRPEDATLLQPGWMVAWTPTVEGAACMDTFLVGDGGPQCLTRGEHWPLVSVRISGADFICPTILER